MAVYLVSYDLNKYPDRGDYARIEKRLLEWKGRKVLFSEYIVRTDSTAAVVRNDLKNYIDTNDTLLVAELTGAAAWQGQLMVSDDDFKRLVTTLS